MDGVSYFGEFDGFLDGLTFSTFITNVPFFTRMNDKMQGQLLLTFKRFQTNRADEWTLRIMGLFVSGEVVFSFQSSVADVANEPKIEK